MFKLIVAGSRSFRDYERLAADLDRLLANRMPDVEIISGACPRGADALGERYARERGLGLRQCPARWERWGAYAGPIRNHQMVDIADACIVYWDGKSRGAANMIHEATDRIRLVVRRF